MDKGDNLQIILAGPCTIMNAVAHNASSDTFVPRQNLIADDKNEAEGAPEEVKVTLGWGLDTISLIVRLPLHKFKSWTMQVESFISRKSANAEDLSLILGRMENIAILIPIFGHFLNNIRHLETKATISMKKQFINMQSKEDFRIVLRQS